MKERVIGLLLAVVYVVSMTIPVYGANAVYFTAADDTLCPLSDDTMPFWSGGTLYVPASLFSSYNLGITYIRDTTAQTAFLYAGRKMLEFDLEKGGANDKQGTYYSVGAVTRRGTLYLPLSFLAGYFPLSYSVLDTPYAPLVRIKSENAILSDAQFTDAAATLMESRYEAYTRGRDVPAQTPQRPQKPVQSEPVAEPAPNEGDEEPGTFSARIYLAVSAGGDRAACERILSLLDRYGYRAAFFFTAEQMEDDLLRRVAASGHRVGIRENGASLRAANERLRNATGMTTRLAVAEEGAAAEGYALFTPSLRLSPSSSAASVRAARLFSTLEKRKGDVTLWIEATEENRAVLENLCARLSTAQAHVRAVSEMQCG